jgi:hypothetical protein
VVAVAETVIAIGVFLVTTIVAVVPQPFTVSLPDTVYVVVTPAIASTGLPVVELSAPPDHVYAYPVSEELAVSVIGTLGQVVDDETGL